MAKPKVKTGQTDILRVGSRSARQMSKAKIASEVEIKPAKSTTRSTDSSFGESVKVPVRDPTRAKQLLQRFAEALARSRAAGRPVSFRVNVAPDGGATATPLEDTPVSQATLPVENTGIQSPELARALSAARERGRISASEILGREDMLSAEAFAELLGTTRVTVNAKRQNGQLLGLNGTKRGFRFPTWQLDAEGRPYAELKLLRERLGGPWALYRFLMQPHGELDGLTGRQALERGKAGAALAAAESIGRGDFR